MKYSVLQELKTYLEGRDITPVFLLSMPLQGADKCVMLDDYGDSESDPWRVDGRLQVRSRSTLNRPEEGKNLIDQVHAILWPATGDTPSVAHQLDTVTIVLKHLHGPHKLGPDAQGRWEYSDNYQIQLGRS